MPYVSAPPAGLPPGAIILWFGAVVNIPSGFQICDGTGGSPDLRDKFIVGAGNSYAVDAVGGVNSHTITVAQMPSHNHPAYGAGAGANYSKADYANLSKNTGSTGGGGSHENRPPYHALCYIMKL